MVDSLRGRALVIAVSLVMAMALRESLLFLGRILVLVLRGNSISQMALPLAGMIGFFFAAFIGYFLYFRRREKNRFDGALLLASLLGYFAVGWALSVESYRNGGAVQFGRVETFYPSSDFWETVPARPKVHYTINARGFRGAEFNDAKTVGVTRVVTIGDSYVFGSGVEAEDTLARQLETALSARVPGRRFEVLNLGVPGDNITSHVDMYEEAQKRLSPDVAVMGLTLPNDLSRWDGQDERREPKRFGAYSAVTYLFGLQAAIFLYGEARLDSKVTAEGLAHLKSEVARLSSLRKENAPPLLILPYSPDPDCTKPFEGKPGVTVIWAPAARDEYFIPNDGHPNAAGNRYFAKVLAEAMVQLPGIAARDQRRYDER